MKIKFESLKNALNLVQGVFPKVANSKQVYLHEGYLIAFFPLMTCKVKLDFEGEFFNCSLSYDTLTKIVNGYQNLYYTKVDEISLEQEAKGIKLEITEIPKEDKDSSFGKTSKFVLDNLPSAQSVIDSFNKELPNEIFTIDKDEMNKVFKTLSPLLSNGTDSSGKLSFSDEYIFFLSNTVSSFLKNNLPESFKGIELSYQAIAQLKRYFDNFDYLNVSKEDGSLVIISPDESVVSYIRFNGLTFQSNKIIEGFKKEKGIVLDRHYLRETLNRLSGFSDQANIKVEDTGLVIEDKNFNQNLPIFKSKGEVAGLGFLININVFNKIILGDDNLMPNEAFLYFVENGRTINLYISDESGEWFSVTAIRSL